MCFFLLDGYFLLSLKFSQYRGNDEDFHLPETNGYYLFERCCCHVCGFVSSICFEFLEVLYHGPHTWQCLGDAPYSVLGGYSQQFWGSLPRLVKRLDPGLQHAGHKLYR